MSACPDCLRYNDDHDKYCIYTRYSKLESQLAEARKENEILLWNLAGCSTFALGYGIHESFRKEIARPALTDVLKLALKEEETRKERDKYKAALEKIACSAPCKKGHESFNTPGQSCDQRIAEQALQGEKEER